MYTFIRSISLRTLLAAQAPVLGVSWLLAELFYKFHSFTLELAAFLATWFVIDGALSLLYRFIKVRRPSSSGA